jgi:hypothetical protein
MLNVFGTITGRVTTTGRTMGIDIMSDHITDIGDRGPIIMDLLTTAITGRRIAPTTTAITGPTALIIIGSERSSKASQRRLSNRI